MEEFAQHFGIMKAFRTFLFVGILFLISACASSQNPDTKFDEEYSDSWDIVSPSVESSQQEKEIPSSTLQKTFQISGTDQGYQCTMTCTKPE